jgi:hypothetical protein
MAVAARKRPVDVKAQPPTAAEIAFRQHLDQRLGGLSIDRYSWWTHWQEIAQYLIPRRYKWLITPNQASRGSPINQRIIDNTGTIGLRVLASGMMSGMTNPTMQWFRLTLDDSDLAEFYTVKVWLDEVGKRMRAVLAESNAYTSLHTLYEDIGAFGTGVMIVYEDFEDVLRCYNSCAGEYYLANSQRMQVDTMYRMFVLTTRQTADMFGVENCSPTVQQAIKQSGAGLAREVAIAHGVEPNDKSTDYLPALRGKPFREAYWEWGSAQNKILRIRGFHENPVIAARWSIFANDAYGRGPGMDALGDIKQLQVMSKREAQAIDKMVNPPMGADVQLKNEPASLLPGGVTYMTMSGSQKPMFYPLYEVKPDLSQFEQSKKEVQNRIKVAFFQDLFQMWAQMEGVQPRNELEIIERKGEKLIQLGPVLERFENEALDPLLNRTYNIMMRAGILPPPPPELRGQHIKTEYVSMLAQAQKAAMTTGLEQLAGFVGRIAAQIPGAAENVDWDEVVQQYAEHTGVSPKVMRPYVEVLKQRAAAAQQQQATQALQESMAAVQGAKVLSETNVGGGKNALESMVGVQ